MSVQFKFKSSASYDTLDIGQNSSISIRDFKSEIALKLRLNLFLDFDLVFSDVSGVEFTDENTRIPSGSRVIIKRIPAKSPPTARTSDVAGGQVGIRDADFINSVEPPDLDFGLNDCDDFGIDSSAPAVGNASNYQKLPSNNNGMKSHPLKRCSGKLPMTGEKLKATVPTQLDRTVAVKNRAVESSGMPPELMCALCTNIFKDAVMIPCCQYSFCKKCVGRALVKNFRCPRCSSTSCKPEHLLPNVTLRQAIQRFLESQPRDNDVEVDLKRIASDSESGIEVREHSFALTVKPTDQQLNRTATKVSAKLPGDTRWNHVGLEDRIREFLAEIMPSKTAGTNEEGDDIILPLLSNSFFNKGQAFRGTERIVVATDGPNKCWRTCYMCGSPDHLLRDCPAVAANPHSVKLNWTVPFQVPVQDNAPQVTVQDDAPQPAVHDHAPQYWPGDSSHSRPHYNMYSEPGMVLHNTNMAAAAPYALSPYASTMLTGSAVTSEWHSRDVNVGGSAPPSAMNAPPQLNQTDALGLIGCSKQQGHPTEALESGEVLDRAHNVDRQHANAGKGRNHSSDSFARRSEGKHRSHERSDDDRYSDEKRREKISRSSDGGRNFRNAQSDRSLSKNVTPDNRIRSVVVKVENHEDSQRYSKSKEDVRAHYDSGSSKNYHLSNKESIQRRRTENERRSDRGFYTPCLSRLQPSYSSNDGRHRRDESDPRSRDSKRNPKPNGKDVYEDRGRMNKYSDDDYDYSHKKKRYH